MALEPINVGLIINDGTGDDLRTAFLKVNRNFEELELQGGQANTISNVGTGVGLYKEKIGVDLRLKSLKAGYGITITSNPMDVTIENTANTIIAVNADTGRLTASSSTQEISIVGGAGISTSITGSILTINSNNYNIETDTSPTLGGDLDLNGFNIIGGAGTTITANNFVGNLTGNVTGNLTGNVTGNLTGLVNGIDIKNIDNFLNIFDFGPIIMNVTNPMQLILMSIQLDMGTVDNPNPIGIEGGSFI